MQNIQRGNRIRKVQDLKVLSFVPDYKINLIKVTSQDKEKRMEYGAREKAILDYNQSVLEAEQRGELKGRAEGRVEGRLEGEKNGIARINKLNSILIAANRFDDLKLASEDVSYQSALMEELLAGRE